MNIYFRSNLGIKEGLGHISRVSNLATVLKKKNHNCEIFIDHIGKENLFFNYDLVVRSVYFQPNKFINELEDAKQFCSIILDQSKSIVIVDDYRLGYVWEKYVSKYFYKIVCIDDYIEKRHYVDFFINAKPSFNNYQQSNLKNLKYKNKKNCNFLLGSKYSIINSRFNKKIYNKNEFNLVF